MKFIAAALILMFLGSLSAAEMPNLIKNGSFEEGLDKNGAPKHWIIDRNDKVDGVVKTAGTDYTVALAAGSVTFTTAPPVTTPATSAPTL